LATTLRHMDCCAAAEIVNLSESASPGVALAAILPDLLGRPFNKPVFVVFTGVTVVREQEGFEGHARTSRRDDYGRAFKEFIENNEFGTVHESGERVNNNSGNSLRMWVWEPDYRKFLGMVK